MKILCFFLSVLLFFSCASVDSEKPTPAPPTGNVTVKKNEKYTAPSMREQHDKGRWVSGMQDGAFIIIGVSSILTRQADEIEAAKLDAARKAALYHGIQGNLTSTNTSGTDYFDYSANSTLNLSYDKNYEQYMERLSYNPEKDLIRGNGATYIRFQYNISGPDVIYISDKSTGRPVWTNSRNLPQFPGYVTVVGYAGKRTWMRDTINASCESAIAELIKNTSSQFIGIVNDGQSSSSTIDIYSEGSLTNFHIMETWIDTANGAVFTLAAARISQ